MLKQENTNTMDMFSLDDGNINSFSNYSDDLLNLELGSINSQELGTINSEGNLVMLSPPEISEDTLDVAATKDPSSEEHVLVGLMKQGKPKQKMERQGKADSTSQPRRVAKRRQQRKFWAFAMRHAELREMSSKNCVLPPTRGPPARTVFSGGLNFSVDISALDTHRKKYLYSHLLNRIYVDIKTDFPVQFRWDFARAPGPMFVRATTVFLDDSQAEKRVERCIQHTHDSANAEVNMSIVKNVLHSSREPYTHGIFYSGDPALPDSWYSVLVQFEGNGTEAHSHAYQFVCKNSCSSGINRRPIAIIFTLEDQFGRVHGRHIVGARVCACPRRDKLKDEEGAGADGRPGAGGGAGGGAAKRRVAPPGGASKRVKQEVADADVFVLPPVSIVGLKTVITGLEVMLSMMEQVAEAKKHDPQATEPYQNSMNTLRSEIDKLRNHPNGEGN